MPHLQNNEKIRQTSRIGIILPAIGMDFSKKPTSQEKSEDNPIDVHLELINKIDNLLRMHESGTLSEESEPPQQPSINVLQAPPVELRVPLNKSVELSEVSPETETILTPLEFKSDVPLTKNPAFRFVTTLDSSEDMFQEKDIENERVEIIDLRSFMVDDTTAQTLSASTRKQTRPVSKKTDSHKKQSKKVEIIDPRIFKKDQSEQVFVTEMKQLKENEEKAKLYYLKSSKHQKSATGKSKDHDSYIPVSFEEKMRQIQEKQKEIEQEQQLREQKEKERRLKEEQKRIEKEQREREIEQKKLAELEAKKAELEEKEKQKKEQEREKLSKEEQKQREKELRQKEKEEKKRRLLEAKQAKKEAKQKEREMKKALKEQKEQQLLEAKQTKKESMQREQEAKQALKEEKKKAAEEQKQLKKIQLMKEKEQIKEEQEEIPEMPILDEDIRKFITITDNLLAELPDEVIDRFANSKDFEFYERVLAKYKIK